MAQKRKLFPRSINRKPGEIEQLMEAAGNKVQHSEDKTPATSRLLLIGLATATLAISGCAPTPPTPTTSPSPTPVSTPTPSATPSPQQPRPKPIVDGPRPDMPKPLYGVTPPRLNPKGS